jgi:hypothetical protein
MRYIQIYEINVRVWEFVIKKIAHITSDLRQVGGFLRVLRFPLTIKLTATI